MRVRIDQEADAVYIELTDRVIENSEEVSGGIVVDFDKEGRVVGVEIWTLPRRPGTRRPSSGSTWTWPTAR